MKTFVLIIVLAALQICLFAQDDDRTTVKQLFPLTYENIAKKAAIKWPGDFEMQKYTIEKQCEALIEYRILSQNYTVPKDVYNQVLDGAMVKWCENDWINCVDEKIKAGLKDIDLIDAIQACFSADWEMIIYEMKKQIDAYNSLK